MKRRKLTEVRRLRTCATTLPVAISKSGDQGLRSVPDVLIGPALRFLGAERQQWLRAIQGLNARLFVHADNQGILRRIQVQAHDIQQFRLRSPDRD